MTGENKDIGGQAEEEIAQRETAGEECGLWPWLLVARCEDFCACVRACNAAAVSSIFLTFLKIGRAVRAAITNPFADDT